MTFFARTAGKKSLQPLGEEEDEGVDRFLEVVQSDGQDSTPKFLEVDSFPLEEANNALLKIKSGAINGAAVLKIHDLQ